ncbi:MAG: PAS domain-containing protein, partial [Proteobacteria bacterium]|nr:PAS domain-containing protein [Pseudomonadota bacterium]
MYLFQSSGVYFPMQELCKKTVLEFTRVGIWSQLARFFCRFTGISKSQLEKNALVSVNANLDATLKAAIEAMSDAVFISDKDGQFIHFNEAFASFHRFKDKSAVLKALADYPDLLEVFLPDGSLAPLSMWAVPRALRGESVTDAEYIIRRKDTQESWVGLYNFSPIRDIDGAITGSVVIAKDITEQKRLHD